VPDGEAKVDLGCYEEPAEKERSLMEGVERLCVGKELLQDGQAAGLPRKCDAEEYGPLWAASRLYALDSLS